MYVFYVHLFSELSSLNLFNLYRSDYRKTFTRITNLIFHKYYIRIKKISILQQLGFFKASNIC